MAANRFCPHCGNGVSSGVNFCNKCGHRLTGAGETNSTYAQTEYQQDTEPPIRSKIIRSHFATVLFTVLFAIPPVASTIVYAGKTVGIGNRHEEIAIILLLFMFLPIFALYRIFCRVQYARIKREYILPGRINKIGSNLFLGMHLAIILVFTFNWTGMWHNKAWVTVVFTGGSIIGLILWYVNMRKQYGSHTAKDLCIMMMRSSAGRPINFEKKILAFLNIANPYIYNVSTPYGTVELCKQVGIGIYQDMDGNRYYAE